jgi:hypothetical protein
VLLIIGLQIDSEWSWIKLILQLVLIFWKEVAAMLSNLKKPEVTIRIAEIGVRLRSMWIITCFSLF